MIEKHAAEEILEALHAAWSRQDLEGTLRYYHPEIDYYCNMGGADGNSLRVHGISAMRNFLGPVLKVAECISVPLTLSFHEGVARAQIQIRIRHLDSGNMIQSTFRQMVVFQDGLIKALDEFHDGARMKVFWEMVQGPVNPLGKNRSIISRLISDASSGQSPDSGNDSDL